MDEMKAELHYETGQANCSVLVFSRGWGRSWENRRLLPRPKTRERDANAE